MSQGWLRHQRQQIETSHWFLPISSYMGMCGVMGGECVSVPVKGVQ